MASSPRGEINPIMSFPSPPQSFPLPSSGPRPVQHLRRPVLVISSEEESELELSLKNQPGSNSSQRSPNFDTGAPTSTSAGGVEAVGPGTDFLEESSNTVSLGTWDDMEGNDSYPNNGRARYSTIHSDAPLLSYQSRASAWGSILDSDSTSHSGYDSGESGRLDLRGLVRGAHLLSSPSDSEGNDSDWGLDVNDFQTPEASSFLGSNRKSRDQGGVVPSPSSQGSVGAPFEGDPPPPHLSVPRVSLPPIIPDSPPTIQHEEAALDTGLSGPSSDIRENSALKLPAPPAKAPVPERRAKSRKRGKQIDRFNPYYVELLNETISSANSRGVYDSKGGRTGKRWPGSYILGSWWTPEEKDKFFGYLAISGRDISALSKAVGTKSIIECHAYLKMLHKGRMDHNRPTGTRGKRLARLRDIPAATEISDECLEALDEAARLVEDRTLRDEQKREKTLWGDFWVLDLPTAEHIEALYADDEIEDIHDIAPEAELLNIYSMLQLSERIFMNFPEDNWQDLGEVLPSIRYTAFTDFHTLVVSLTRRIVSTTLFMTESRLRSTAGRIFHPQRIVNPCDVISAIQSLGLSLNSEDYWAKIPRRLGFKILKKKPYSKKIVAVPYDEFECFPRTENCVPKGERCVWSDGNQKASENESNLQKDENFDGNRSLESDTGYLSSTGSYMDMPNPNDSEVYGPEDGIVPNPEALYGPRKERKRILAREKDLEAKEDLYLEALDQKKSLQDEKQLWEMLGKEPGRPLPEAFDLPKLPRCKRKRPADLMDWMDSLEYIAPWESAKKSRLQNAEVERVSTTLTSTETQPRVPMLELNSVIPQSESHKRKPAASAARGINGRKHVLTKSSPRKLRTRRPVALSPGFVSTVENVPETDAENPGQENQDEESEGSAHREAGGYLN